MLATFERSAHLIAAYLDHALSQPRVTQAEAHVLARLHRRGPTSIADLQREFGHKRSTLTGVIDRLERRGFVRREINQADRRSFVIHLTRQGQAAARRVTAVLDRLERHIQARLTERDITGLEAVAAALGDAVTRIGA
jgi:MarR family transcriptional regulator, organic hydroperoxide resistance regulator